MNPKWRTFSAVKPSHFETGEGTKRAHGLEDVAASAPAPGNSEHFVKISSRI